MLRGRGSQRVPRDRGVEFQAGRDLCAGCDAADDSTALRLCRQVGGASSGTTRKSTVLLPPAWSTVLPGNGRAKPRGRGYYVRREPDPRKIGRASCRERV